MSETKEQEPLMGWLHKWTNYLKGYQKRWFVLSNGLLSYYKSQHDMQHLCCGSVSVRNAIITTTDPHSFIISNGGNHTFHIRAANKKERQTWLCALASAKQVRSIESEVEDESTVNYKSETATMMKQLATKLEELQACKDVIPKHWSALHRSLTELEVLKPGGGTASFKEVNERATLFRITSSAMVNKCIDFNDFAQNAVKKWQQSLQRECDQRQSLEEMVEQLAQQHSSLEKAAIGHHRMPRAGTSLSDEDEFYDAYSQADKVEFSSQTYRKEVSNSSSEADDARDSRLVTVKPSGSFAEGSSSKIIAAALSSGNRIRRTRVPDKPNFPLNLWSIIKNSIGKELSKIPMPVNFSEPLSMLQRLTEDYEYAHILDKAASCVDSCEQMAYVAAFTTSSYATTAIRTAKPFNPLLGETFECDRTDDLGWRSISEQVSHHPPMVAQYCEGKEWKCWQEFTMSSKFFGNYLQVIPLGISHLTFNNSKNHYTWRKVTTTVLNIVVGKLWVDNHGEMDIKNHSTGDECYLKYHPYRYFRENERKVNGCVKNKDGVVKYLVSGAWDSKMEISQVLSTEGKPDNPKFNTAPPIQAWLVNPMNPDSEKFYNFSVLAAQLNEPEDGVAPTDSRLRPDQRLMEEGEWDSSNVQKIRLEEKQRAVRRAREAADEECLKTGEVPPSYEPIWFRLEQDPLTGGMYHVYGSEYWGSKERQDWSKCPDIF